LRDEQKVNLGIYDITGRKIKTLWDGEISGGNHRLIWNGTDSKGKAMPSGIYFCKLQSDESAQSRKLILTK